MTCKMMMIAIWYFAVSFVSLYVASSVSSIPGLRSDNASTTGASDSVFSQASNDSETLHGNKTVQVFGITDTLINTTVESVLHDDLSNHSINTNESAATKFHNDGNDINQIIANNSKVVNQSNVQGADLVTNGNITDRPVDSVTKEATHIRQQNNDGHDKIFHEILQTHKPYHVHSAAEKVHRLNVERQRLSLQHHLHLVPMEDEPIDSIMAKDQRYLISVLVPICIGMLGASMIVGTVCTLRYVAKKRATLSPFDNNTETEGPNTPCISSISTESTDKVFLLRGDDEI